MAEQGLSERQVGARALETLRSVFGYDGFRPLQAEIVATLLTRRDAFVLMPTGGGKSLCYQLPALLHGGLTVVVSPLIALMKDQVDALRALGVAATFVNSSLEAGEIGRRQAAIARGEVSLLYVAPERLLLPTFLPLLRSQPPTLFAIDEAHCISEWGHDFRPEYRELRRLRELFPASTVAAFTATATSRVQADIRTQLGLEQAALFRGSFDRPNLLYLVRPRTDGLRQIVDYLRGRPSGSGIVYCLRRADTERLAERLTAAGFPATAYHAGLDHEQRRARQEAFVRDDVRIVVATIAFGMGIDKPDVRFVIHHDLPKNLEGYYQESGRAGRDSLPSDCLLLYSYADAVKHEYFIKQKETERERQIARDQLRRMVRWADGGSCRRRSLLAYFDEALREPRQPCCDLCAVRSRASRPAEPAPPGEPAAPPAPPEGAPLVDWTVPAQKLLSCAVRTGQRFGASHLIRILRGSRDSRLLELGHDRLPTYGIGADLSRSTWHELVAELTRAELAEIDLERFSALRVTARGRALLAGREQLWVARAEEPAARSSEGPAPNGALFERLRALRKRLADERGVPPYVVFGDATLREMTARLPRTTVELLRVAGVGDFKAREYGPLFLACIQSALEAPESEAGG